MKTKKPDDSKERLLTLFFWEYNLHKNVLLFIRIPFGVISPFFFKDAS